MKRNLRNGMVLGAMALRSDVDGIDEGVRASAQEPDIDHVLLISVDGMHALDYLNCASGLASVNGGMPYCPNLKALGTSGVNYLNTSTSKPSDSFPD